MISNLLLWFWNAIQLMLLAKYQITNPQNNSGNFLIGFGGKLATEKINIRCKDGIINNLDLLQPGTGAVDGLFWMSTSHSPRFRPSMSLNAQVAVRRTGVYDDYLGSQAFEIGDNYRIHVGMSEQWAIGRNLLNVSIDFKYRLAMRDRIDDQKLENTGGQWLFISPQIRWPVNNGFTFSVQFEIPMFASIRGEQLTTTYRSTSGLYYSRTLGESFQDHL